MEMITDETFEFDLPGLEDFLDLRCVTKFEGSLYIACIPFTFKPLHDV